MIYKTKLGCLELIFDNGYIVEADFIDSNETVHSEEIDAYLNGEAETIDLEYKMPTGTDFQMSVWKEIAKIPYGETRTYSYIARKIKNPGAQRAVARACGANPLPLFVPCHRVVGKNDLGGFSYGLKMKKKLLAMEKKST